MMRCLGGENKKAGAQGSGFDFEMDKLLLRGDRLGGEG